MSDTPTADYEAQRTTTRPDWHKWFRFWRIKIGVWVMRHNYIRGDHRWVFKTDFVYDTKPKGVGR